MERPPRGDGSSAARWAHQQNVGESDQDRQDWRDGVRCRLKGGPLDERFHAARAEDQLAPSRGYAPELFTFCPDDPDIQYHYLWVRRDPDGIHQYEFDSRRVRTSSGWRREIQVLYQHGPLHDQTLWEPCPGPDAPEVIRTKGDVRYRRRHGFEIAGRYYYEGWVLRKIPHLSEKWEIAADRRASNALQGYAPKILTTPGWDPNHKVSDPPLGNPYTNYCWGHRGSDGTHYYRYAKSYVSYPEWD